MKKWKLIKALWKIFLWIALLIIAIISVHGFFHAELIVDKIHHGFILTFVLFFLCDGNNQNNNNGNLATN